MHLLVGQAVVRGLQDRAGPHMCSWAVCRLGRKQPVGKTAGSRGFSLRSPAVPTHLPRHPAAPARQGGERTLGQSPHHLSPAVQLRGTHSAFSGPDFSIAQERLPGFVTSREVSHKGASGRGTYPTGPSSLDHPQPHPNRIPEATAWHQWSEHPVLTHDAETQTKAKGTHEGWGRPL